MADIEAIYRGIAAELRAVLPADEGQVYPWLLDNPTYPSLMVAGLDREGLEATGFGDDKRLIVVVEAALGLASDVGAQKLLTSWLALVPDTIEAANDPALGALTQRMDDDGVVTTGQAVACDSISFERYRGQARFQFPSGDVALLASWAFEVLT